MITLTLNGRSFPVAEGTRLDDAVLQHQHLNRPCAGAGRCGKCRVLASGTLSPISEQERKSLTAQELCSGLRLACCTRVLGDCTVTTENQRSGQIYTDGNMPSFEQQPMFSAYGVAIDIGTTTLAARLYGRDGLLSEASAANPQSRFGADVISRVGAALAGHGHALALCIREALRSLLAQLAANSAIDVTRIDALVITGNTAMLYLLTETCSDSLAHAPFEADRLFGETIDAKALGLPCVHARVYLPRCISAFVGADITTAILAGELCAAEDTKLLADIGTNGEMVLWHHGELLCCSTAAGPAFEGAGISQGMAGVAGAIDHVRLQNGALKLHVIADGSANNATPTGICGSGIVDALASMKTLAILDESGLLLCEPSDAYALCATVSLTQKDVRMVQLAKSAVCAGMLTLLELAQLDTDALHTLAIAGGFGSYLDLHNAAAIGLYPAALEKQARTLGNAALSGASMLLLNLAFIQETEALAARAHTVELSTSPIFMEHYVDCMAF